MDEVYVKRLKELDKEEKEILYKKALQSSDFIKIFREVDDLNDIEPDKNTFKVGNLMELEQENKSNITIKNIVVEFTKNVVMFYAETSTKNKVLKTDLIVSFKTKTGLIKTEFVENGEVIYQEDDDVGQLQKKLSEDLTQTKEKNEGIQPQAWYDGCYPTFNHCGAGCGDFSSKGGGQPKNVYDSCCRAHDRCWHNFGKRDCECDCQLLSCTKRNWLYAPLALHTIVLGAFPRKSNCNC